jgi:hypothetical protein
MNKEEFSKDFKYTIRTKKGRIVAQSIVCFGTKNKPFPKDWKENGMAQMSIFDYKETFIKETFDVSVEEGNELDDFVIPEGTFDDDWRKEMMKFNKNQLIDFLRDTLIDLQELKNQK